MKSQGYKRSQFLSNFMTNEILGSNRIGKSVTDRNMNLLIFQNCQNLAGTETDILRYSMENSADISEPQV